MKKIKTLKMNYEFKNVLEKGKYYANKQIIVYILENNYDYNRLGIAINSKICNAVKRNHIKRLVREAYRKYERNILTSYDIVIVWNKKVNAEDASYNIICNNLENALSKAGMI